MTEGKKSNDKDIIERISKIDRRVIYWLFIIIVAFPHIRPFGLPLAVTEYTESFYDKIENNYEAGDVCIYSLDVTLSSSAELGGGVVASVRHLSRKGIKIVAYSGSPEGPLIFDSLMKPALDAAGYEYGVDYTYLGYAAGGETLVARLMEDISEVYPTDYYGTPITELPLMDDHNKATDFDFCFGFGNPIYYLRQWYSKYQSIVLCMTTANNFATNFPHLDAGYVDMTNGVNGCAEYEVLLGYSGIAGSSVDSTSMAQLMIIALIFLGNIVYFIQKSRGSN